MTENRDTQAQNPRSRRIGWVLLLAFLLMASFTALVSYVSKLCSVGSSGSITYQAGELAQTKSAQAAGAFSLTPQAGDSLAAGEAGTAGPGPIDPTPTIVFPTPAPWNGKGRVTILVMGLDYADWESEDRVGPPRSDTMILLTIDPVGKTAGMLSIPRDLWVTMPGIEGENKINTAYRFGELYEMPGGGPGLAMRTIEGLIGVPINFYTVIDFYAFEYFIDELGGIEVDVPEEITVDPIGPGNTVTLAPGKQLLDGPTALAYARNRSTGGDESDRAARQEQVILAIRERALSLELLPMLVFKAPLLYSKLGEGIRTNMTLDQAIRLAWLAQEIPLGEIQRAAIGDREVIYDQAPDGQDIFIPVPERIYALRDEIFTSATSGTSQGLTAEELIAAENARIKIINETGDEALGALTEEYLKEKGVNVIQTVNSEESRLKTRLVDHAGDPYTLRYLIGLLHVAPSEIYITLDPEAGADMVVYLGLDWAEDNPF